MWNQRTGNDVAAEAAAELQRSSHAALRQIACDIRDGVLTLSGHVPSYYEKQIAQSLVRIRLPNVAIRNELEVSVRRTAEGMRVRGEESVLA